MHLSAYITIDQNSNGHMRSQSVLARYEDIYTEILFVYVYEIIYYTTCVSVCVCVKSIV